MLWQRSSSSRLWSPGLLVLSQCRAASLENLRLENWGVAPPGRLYKRFLDTQDTRGESLTQHFWNTQEWNYSSGSKIKAKMELNLTGLTGAFIPFHVLIKCKIAALRMGSATFEFFLLCVSNDFNAAHVWLFTITCAICAQYQAFDAVTQQPLDLFGPVKHALWASCTHSYTGVVWISRNVKKVNSAQPLTLTLSPEVCCGVQFNSIQWMFFTSFWVCLWPLFRITTHQPII